MLSVEFQEHLKGAVNVRFPRIGQSLLYQMPRPFANLETHRIRCQERVRKGTPDMIDGIGQIFQRVDQSAVKVKEDSPDGHSGFDFRGASALGRIITGVLAAR